MAKSIYCHKCIASYNNDYKFFYWVQNYMYLAHVPMDSAGNVVKNPLIIINDWPWYILTWEPIVFTLILITYYFSKPKKA